MLATTETTLRIPAVLQTIRVVKTIKTVVSSVTDNQAFITLAPP